MLELTARDRSMLEGDFGEGTALAMRVVTAAAAAMGAERLLDIESAHVDSCIFNGMAGIDFAERLRDGGARVSVPTTLNVASLDLLHPELYRGDPETAVLARRLVDTYLDLGTSPTWTCAPYQLTDRPSFGAQVAWAESNAIVFANSVLGARTERYGDFIDISCAITGRAPAAGLHLDSGRYGTVVFSLAATAESLMTRDVFFPVLGHLIGARSSNGVPVVDGLPRTTTEDQLKALGASAASSGSVGLFHAVGITPEAPTLEAVCPRGDTETVVITMDEITAARDQLTTREGLPLAAVALGTPHMSTSGFKHLVNTLGDATIHPSIGFYVSTGRETLAEIARLGWVDTLERAGVTLVTDTCTYVTPIIEDVEGTVMTDSGKWAWYAPANLGVDVVFGSTDECVASGVAGRVVRDPELWT